MFIIYSSSLHARSTRSICTTQNYIVPNPIIFVHCKEYDIDKTLRFNMLFELTIYKELMHFCCCWSVRTLITLITLS